MDLKMLLRIVKINDSILSSTDEYDMYLERQTAIDEVFYLTITNGSKLFSCQSDRSLKEFG